MQRVGQLIASFQSRIFNTTIPVGSFHRKIGSFFQSSPTVSSISFLSINGPLYLPERGMRCREVKMYYDERGQYNPPVIAVLERFKRLRWGAFIHARPGRKKHLYR